MQTNQNFIPHRIINIFKKEGSKLDGLNQKETFYMETCSVHCIKGTFVPAAMEPIDHKTMKKLVEAFKIETKQRKFKGLLPATLLYLGKRAGHEHVIWYATAGQKYISFSEYLQIDNGTAWCPTLIFEVFDNSLNVYAVKEAVPTADSQVYYAPFFNISSQHQLCLGTAYGFAPKKDDCYEIFMQKWESLFFGSDFTHLGNINPVEGDLISLWKELVNTNTPFPIEAMKPSSVYKTIKDLLV